MHGQMSPFLPISCDEPSSPHIWLSGDFGITIDRILLIVSTFTGDKNRDILSMGSKPGIGFATA